MPTDGSGCDKLTDGTSVSFRCAMPPRTAISSGIPKTGFPTESTAKVAAYLWKMRHGYIRLP